MRRPCNCATDPESDATGVIGFGTSEPAFERSGGRVVPPGPDGTVDVNAGGTDDVAAGIDDDVGGGGGIVVGVLVDAAVVTGGGAPPGRRASACRSTALPIALICAGSYFFLKWRLTGTTFWPKSKSSPDG